MRPAALTAALVIASAGMTCTAQAQLQASAEARAPADTPEAGIALELNKLETVKNACRAYLVVQNRRSEEHTSELQSLMRISYAVFCLKKKKLKHKSIQH